MDKTWIKATFILSSTADLASFFFLIINRMSKDAGPKDASLKQKFDVTTIFSCY